MARKLSFLDNKVARRILVSFILAALIPIGILGLLSYQQVSEQLRLQTAKSLHRSCKDYMMSFIDRLNNFESALRLVAIKVEKFGNGFRLIPFINEQSLVGQFDDLVIVAPNGEKTSLVSKTGFIPDLTALEIQEIAVGKSLIKPVVGPEPGNSRLWMAVSLAYTHHEASILMGRLKPEILWKAENIEPNELWVMNETNQLLFASKPDFVLPREVRSEFSLADSGQFDLNYRDDAYVGVYRNLPLKALFASGIIVIVQAQPESLAFAAIQQFSAIYPPVIVLAVLIVALLSARLITKYLTPLERLKAATLRIAEGDFSSRVNINSHDEFEELADSFNEMTRRLRSQFDILSTMAEIDRHILSALDATEIVDIALTRLPGVLYCDLISIAKVDPETYQVSDIHTRRTGHDTDIMAKPIMLGQKDILSLLEKQGSLIETNVNGKLSAYLKAFRGVDDWTFLIVPVVVNGTLSSIICLGYQGRNPIPPESRDAVRNFGDRIAVALSNAAWEEKLYQQAHYDPLTGLPNRLVLNDRLMQELARAKRDHTQLAVLFIDLDRFKTVNDSLGHAAGDELLTQVSRIFVNCVRETDLVVRIGGDEFVIVITDLHNHHNPMSMVSSIAEKILAALNHTLVVAGHAMTFTASLGVAIFPRDADNPQDLLKNADAAMYHAKDEGRANFRFYSPELNAAALENIKLEQELRGAIAREELRVYYQPKVDLSRRIVGAEALIRWQHAELGFISPAKFIPLAEHTGLIVEIGQWVFEQTCLWVKACHAKGFRPIRVSVNLSGIEFKRPDLVDKIAEILSKTGVNPQFIELELTESVAIGNIKDSVERMHKLKALGLSLSMDDFGTGFSSLSYLKELPLDIIKIDQSFVRHLELEKSSQAIVKSILALAHGLSMETVAEGVENEAQFDFLEQNQCQVFQGFLFSRPIPGEDFLKLLAESPVKEEPSKA
ncbi:diguanylate cyclase/phosphodiesterase [Methyloglobulus morosus KoM1]|uniref:cyclic-guanylate-specific phosphodiesterase n=1 Tax=Methyloglobulus morosus KoM1 TaxID=1116472 RepID=V5BXK7_9GAMM|nr:EAL domain-containing protein [Methyloglobulus morosus]ESS72554.1 diguanylate cyclase/phosphodiesterase [Methyloglobulus morosus KoM1]